MYLIIHVVRESDMFFMRLTFSHFGGIVSDMKRNFSIIPEIYVFRSIHYEILLCYTYYRRGSTEFIN